MAISEFGLCAIHQVRLSKGPRCYVCEWLEHVHHAAAYRQLGIEIRHDEEADAWVGTWRGLISQGETEEEAIAAVIEACFLRFGTGIGLLEDRLSKAEVEISEWRKLGAETPGAMALVLELSLDTSRRLREAMAENRRLRLALRNKVGDDLCWLSDPEMGKALPEAEAMESCRRFQVQMRGERGVVKGCMTIAQLEARVAELEAEKSNLDFSGGENAE